MDDELDPEVQADLELRDRSQFDRNRKGDPGPWQPSPVLELWPCRGRCGAQVPVTQEALSTKAVFDAETAKRKEPPLDAAQIVFCDACRKLGMAMGADNRAKQRDKIATLVRELRGGTTHPMPPGPAPRAEREREILASLAKLGHPDVDGLVRSLTESRNRKTNGPRSKV